MTLLRELRAMQAQLPPPSGSVYGNPPPCHYGDGDSERFLLAGRLTVQVGNLRCSREEGDFTGARRAMSIINELLGHYYYADSRSASAAIDRAERHLKSWP